MTLVAVVGVLVFQRYALTLNFEYIHNDGDYIWIRRGYQYALGHGTGHWWHGPWIHLGFSYFRPIASYVHFAQFWVLDQYGLLPLTLFSMFMYAALAIASDTLAYLLTERRAVAYAVCAVLAS